MIRLRTKLLLLLLLFSTAPMLAVLANSHSTFKQASQESTLDTLQAVARAKAEAIDQFTTNRRSDVERMAGMLAPRLVRLRAVRAATPPAETPEPELPNLEDAEKLGTDAAKVEAESASPSESPPPDVAPPEEKKSAPEEEKALEDLSLALGLLLWDQSQFEELLVIDGEGRVVDSTFSDHTGRSAAELEYFRAGRRATYVQPVFLSPITEKLTMVISTPIRDEKRATVGVFAARLNLTGFFRLVNDYTGLGVTGETIVGKKIGDEIVFMAPTRHDADAALARKVRIGANRDQGIQDAARGQIGRGRDVDYRGAQVFSAWHDVPELQWGLVTKIDYDEATAGWDAARDGALYTALALLAFVVVASFIAASSLVAPLRQLRNAAERISRGDFDVQLEINSRDEIGELSDSFERMIASIKYFRSGDSNGADADADADAEDGDEDASERPAS